MKIRLIAVGTKMPAWVSAGFHEYQKRLPRELTLELVELSLGQRSKHQPTERAIRQEGDAMLAALGKGEHVVALEVQGKAWSTPQLAAQLTDWQMQGQSVALLVGGPDGLDERCLELAQQTWSLSPLTLPHPLVRVVLAEQLYRAWSLNQGHPYHK